MKFNKKKMIGIVGGMGPYAGIDLVKKIFDLTNASSDQDHIPVAMISTPHLIEDRTKYLTGHSKNNPGIAIAEIVNKLVSQGASIIGMPCNTAHAPPIFDKIKKVITNDIVFVHMIEEVVQYIKNQHPDIINVGLLATAGTINTKIYENELYKKGITPVLLSDLEQKKYVDSSIYDSKFGIKSFSNPVKEKAKQKLGKAIQSLINMGSQTIIMGCTEIPIAIKESFFNSVPLIDSTMILARAILHRINIDKKID
tara:strand:- start:3175 stop:3936 length:762 start_codon:yes stop_codon:yes gene_type:complete